MWEITLADIFRTKLDLADLVVTGFARDRTDFKFVARNCDDIKVVKINRVAGVSDNSANVAGEKIFLFAHSEDQRRAAPGADHEVFDIGMNQRNAVGADHLFQRRAS